MSILDQTAYTGPHAAAIHHDMDSIAEQLHALEVKTVRLAQERDAERTRANLAEQAGVDMVNAIAWGIRREEALQAELAQAGTENTAQYRVNLALQGHLDDASLQGQRYRERIARLIAAEEQLRIELRDAIARLAQAGPRHRFRRGH